MAEKSSRWAWSDFGFFAGIAMLVFAGGSCSFLNNYGKALLNDSEARLEAARSDARLKTLENVARP